MLACTWNLFVKKSINSYAPSPIKPTKVIRSKGYSLTIFTLLNWALREQTLYMSAEVDFFLRTFKLNNPGWIKVKNSQMGV